MSTVGIGGFSVPEMLIATFISCGMFLVVPLVIYFVVRRAAADGVNDASKRGDKQP